MSLVTLQKIDNYPFPVVEEDCLLKLEYLVLASNNSC